MQFKREDIGLYVATALIGGGLGLLAGAFLTARINKKRNEDFNAADAARDESWHPEDEPTDERATLGVTFNVTNPYATVAEEEIQDGISNKQLKKTQLEIAEKATVADIENRVTHGKQEESHRLSKEDRDELARLTREYTVAPFQEELVEKGTMTLEELEDALIEEELDIQPLDESVEVLGEEPINYSRPYRFDDKPDMADFLEKPIDDVPRDVNDLLVTLDNRWEILLTPPKGKSLQQKRTIFFDPDDESVYTKSHKGDVAPADLRVIASKEVQELIMPWLLFEDDLETIYIDDIRNKKTRWYEIVRLKKSENADY